MLTVKVLGDYIDGRFRRPRGAAGRIISRDPGDTGYRIGSFPVYPEHVETAVLAAREAFDGWRRQDPGERADLLRKFAAEVINRRAEIVRLVAAESGKPVWEAEADLATVEAQVETEVREGVRAVNPFQVGEVRWGVTGACRFPPLGVVAVLGPAASPLDLPAGLILPALLAGNTVVYKPSKLVPACGQLMASLFDAIDLPRGVFNLIQAEAAGGMALVGHRAIDAVLFAGAIHSGRRILEATAEHPHRLVALQMGGVNPAVVLEDANLDRAVYECLRGCFLTAGQRYTSTGVILVARSFFETFVEAFVTAVRGLRVGYAFTPQVAIGPLLSAASLERALDREAKLVDLGARRLVAAERLERRRPGHYLSPSVLAFERPMRLDALRPEGQSFGPDVVVVPFGSDAEAVELANSTEFRLAASVLTEDPGRFDTFLDELRFGVVNHNLATTEVSPRLPLAGQGRSANHRPLGVFSQRNCTTPVSSLRAGDPFDPSRCLPGFARTR